MDRWWHDGLWYYIVLDTALFVSVTHEYRSFKGATVQFAVSGDLKPTACPAPTGCKGGEKTREVKVRSSKRDCQMVRARWEHLAFYFEMYA